MELFTTNYINKPNQLMEWGKIIVPSLVGILVPIFTIWWTQNKENERLKINKEFDLKKQKHNFLFEKKLNVISSLYEKLIMVKDGIYPTWAISSTSFDNTNDMRQYLNSINTSSGNIEEIIQIWNSGDKNEAERRIAERKLIYIDNQKQSWLIDIRKFFYLNEILINNEEISEKMNQLDKKLCKIISFYANPPSVEFPLGKEENQKRDEIRDEAKNIINELKGLLKKELEI
ncbi:MAG TPA: hypothetical protein P5556_02245 [Candidatus Gastranaerophilales bacterium]|nr:hypothetical protein [Candidatus Gastranaerophilales bacterium]